jgi:penicillin-binding protein 1A
MSRSRRPRPRRAPAPAVRPRRSRRPRARRGRKVALVLVVLALVLIAAGIAAGGAVLAFGSRCDLGALRPTRIGQNTFVYAADGSLLGVIPAERNREVVTFRRISPWLRQATVAIEDRRFYEHGGLDAEGIARALWRDVKAGKVVEGGSTITQQLVRNLYISNERTVRRKVTEACLAVKLDDAWSKQKILATYLNSVFYGNLAYGAEAASRTYFSRSARSLTLPQAALLAGLTQAPTTYDPLVDPTRALQRRNQVLAAMRDEGLITAAQHRWARRQPIGLRPGRLYEQIREPYFFGYVRDQLVEAYGAETVRSGGLKVYTTIEPRWQRLARKAIGDTLTRTTDPAAAIVSIDPANGAIRAMSAIVPGRANNQFNLLSQARRQPGSTFKSIVLAAAVAQGMDPASTYYVSAPFMYRPTANGNCDDGSWWCVHTYDSSYTGWTSVERATLRSDNSVYAQLTLDVGPARVAAMARRLGVRTPLQVNGAYPPAMGLGSVAVSPLDMASAYATLAAGGVYNEPTAIRRVILNGKPDDRWAAHHRRTRVIPDGVAAVVTGILEDNVHYGTGTAAALDRPVAGKTGTTDKHADAWFVGYTPGLSTAVWMGYTRGEVPMTNVHGISVSGGSFPAQIWRRFMEPALARLPARDFPAPRQPVTFETWHRGPWALSYDPYYYRPPAPSTTTTDQTTTTPAPAEKSATARKAPTDTPTPSTPSGGGGTGDTRPAGPSANGGRPAEP